MNCATFLHRDKERLRHRKFLYVLDTVASYVPNHPERKESKVQKMRRILLYTSFLNKMKQKLGIATNEPNKVVKNVQGRRSFFLGKPQRRYRGAANIVFLREDESTKFNAAMMENSAVIQSSASCSTEFENTYNCKSINQGCSGSAMHDRSYVSKENRNHGSPEENIAILQDHEDSQSFGNLPISGFSNNLKRPFEKNSKSNSMFTPSRSFTHHVEESSDSIGSHITERQPFAFGSEKFQSEHSAFLPYVPHASKITDFSTGELPSAGQHLQDLLPMEITSCGVNGNHALDTDVDLKGMSEETAYNDLMSSFNATRYLLHNLSPSSSDMNDDGFNAEDSIIEPMQYFQDRTFKIKSKENDKKLSPIADKSQEEKIPYGLFCDASFVGNLDRYIPHYYENFGPNELKCETEAACSFNAHNFYVPQHSFMAADVEENENAMYMLPTEQEQSACCKSCSLTCVDNTKPFLPPTEHSFSLNFMNAASYE